MPEPTLDIEALQAQIAALQAQLAALQKAAGAAGGPAIIAQGGSVVAGPGGVAVGGDVHGGIVMGGAAGRGRTDGQDAGAMRDAEIASLRSQLDTRALLILALEEQQVTAAGPEAARLQVEIDQEKEKRRRLQQRLDELNT